MLIFSFRAVKINNHLNVRKVSSGFEYFLLIFAGETVLAVYLVVLDAEFDLASSDDIFEGGHRRKSRVLRRKTTIFRQLFTVILADIRWWNCAGCPVGCAGCRIWSCVEWWYFLGGLVWTKIWRWGRRSVSPWFSLLSSPSPSLLSHHPHPHP